MCIRIQRYCFFDIRIFVYIIGVLSTIYSFVKAILFVYIIATFEDNERFANLKESDRKGIKTVCAVFVVTYAFVFLFSILMILGTKLEEHELMRPWLIAAFIFITVHIAPAIYSTYHGLTTLSAINWIDPVVAACSFVCVYSEYKDIKDYSY